MTKTGTASRTKTWKRVDSKDLLARQEATARTEADRYLTGEKVAYWESPKMRQLHGRGPRDAQEMADDTYAQVLNIAEVGRKYPHAALQTLRDRKAHSGRRVTRTI